ncbi:MAG TPA: CPBP family intramembrane glutamic endopeptidase [Terriglobales bacterium]|nr:CPBP family intramembrane glutamic endopeptidase [Terriglobales bacterium]
MPSILNSTTLLFFTWVCVFMPWAAWTSYRKIKSGQPLTPKLKRFRMGAILLTFTGLISYNTAEISKIKLSFQPEFWSLLYGGVFLLALIHAVARGQHRVPAEHRERIRLLYAPTTPTELSWSLLNGTCAGVFEEITYRAVLYELFGRQFGYGISFVLCVLFFVVAHLPQGLRGAIGVAILAMLFHITYILSGSLLAPILVHAIYDVALFIILYLRERKNPVALQQPIEQPA